MSSGVYLYKAHIKIKYEKIKQIPCFQELTNTSINNREDWEQIWSHKQHHERYFYEYRSKTTQYLQAGEDTLCIGSRSARLGLKTRTIAKH